MKAMIARKNKGGITSACIDETIQASPEQIKEFNDNLNLCAQQIEIDVPFFDTITLQFVPYKGSARHPKLKLKHS